MNNFYQRVSTLSLFLGIVVFGPGIATDTYAQPETVTIAAANSLRDVFRKVLPLFEAQHPEVVVRVIYGPSQNLRKQIEEERQSMCSSVAGRRNRRPREEELGDSRDQACVCRHIVGGHHGQDLPCPCRLPSRASYGSGQTHRDRGSKNVVGRQGGDSISQTCQTGAATEVPICFRPTFAGRP